MNPRSSTSFSAYGHSISEKVKCLIDIQFDVVVTLVVDEGFLTAWQDLLSLSSINRACRSVLCGKRLNDALVPLLKHLEERAGSNRCLYCEKIYVPESKRECKCPKRECKCLEAERKREECQSLMVLDPRYQQSYESLSIMKKCISPLNDAFLGIGPIDPCGTGLGDTMLQMVSEMCPFDDIDFKQYVQNDVYPTKEDAELLGSVLVEKLVLAAPLFQYFPFGEQIETERKLDLDLEEVLGDSDLKEALEEACYRADMARALQYESDSDEDDVE